VASPKTRLARPNWIRPGSAHQYRKYHHFRPQGFPKYNSQRNNWERGESSHQSQKQSNRRFVRPCWWSPRQYKEVEFTVPDLAQSEISSARRLRGPRPLRIARTIVQSPRDQWPMSSNRYTLPPRGDRFIPTEPNRPYYRACMNDYQARLTYPRED
jgi:hypothetical protein